MIATTKDAFRLFMEGTLALADIENNGMRIDVARLDQAILDTGNKIDEITEELKQDEIWKLWKKKFGENTKMGSRPQLASLLFGSLGFVSTSSTTGGKSGIKKPKLDESVLESIDHPFVKKFSLREKLRKTKSTYLEGIRREVVDGLLRPSFNLNLVTTFRGSCNSPNFQNIPIRDKVIGELIRSCFIPRPGCVITENDYGALEFRAAAIFWGDENMIEYASDPKKDIHRDVAMEAYKLTKDQVTKDCRFYAKNQFVFPQLYGSDYINCSRNLWDVITSAELKTKEGVPLKEHLKSKGITKLGKLDRDVEPESGTFEAHIRKVEKKFYGWFPEWDEKRKQWWKKYQKLGYFDTLTGFRCVGVYTRNNLFNTPIQSIAFHFLLWSLIQANKEMKRRKMKSVIIGQIHDSINGDIYEDELEDYFALVSDIMENKVREHWDWICVPLVSECEIATPTWFNKRPWPEKN